MRISKRVLGLCLVGCCGLGLWLTAKAIANPTGLKAGQEVGYDDRVKNDILTAYCPKSIAWQFNGIYYYNVTVPGADCLVTGIILSPEIYPIGCDCSDPIYSAPSRLLPLPKSDETADLAPKPDPLFSGVLR